MKLHGVKHGRAKLRKVNTGSLVYYTGNGSIQSGTVFKIDVKGGVAYLPLLDEISMPVSKHSRERSTAAISTTLPDCVVNNRDLTENTFLTRNYDDLESKPRYYQEHGQVKDVTFYIFCPCSLLFYNFTLVLACR